MSNFDNSRDEPGYEWELSYTLGISEFNWGMLSSTNKCVVEYKKYDFTCDFHFRIEPWVSRDVIFHVQIAVWKSVSHHILYFVFLQQIYETYIDKSARPLTTMTITAYFKPSTWALDAEPSSFAPNNNWSNADMDPVPVEKR